MEPRERALGSMEKRVRALAIMREHLPDSGSGGNPPDPEVPRSKRERERLASLWRHEAKSAWPAWRAAWHRNAILRQELFENRLEAAERRQQRETGKWNALGCWWWDPIRPIPSSVSWFWDDDAKGWWWRPTAWD